MKFKSSLLKAVWLFGIVLLVMIGRGLPLPVLIGGVILLLALPIVRELWPGEILDERQLYIGRLSSHIAFYVFVGLVTLVMVRDFVRQHQNPPPVLYMLLLVPLMVKLLIVLFQNYDVRKAALWIGYGWWGVWTLFVVFSHGISLPALIEMSPFILLVFLLMLFRKKSLIIGFLFLVFAVGLTVFFGGWMRLDFYVRILMYTLIPLPLLVSGSVLIWNFLQERSQNETF